MKATAIILSASLSLAPIAASAQSVTCTQIGIYTYCNAFGGSHTFGSSFAQSYLRGLNVASHYAMVNAYREAHGLPRCHYGLLGAIMSATDGRPMC